MMKIDFANIPPEQSHAILIEAMRKGEHEKLSFLHNKFGLTSNTARLANYALSSMQHIKDMTLYMIVKESVGYRWNDKLFEDYDCNIFNSINHLSSSKQKKKFWNTYIDVITSGFNDSSNTRFQKTAYEILYFASENQSELDEKIIYLDINKVKSYAENKVAANKALEDGDYWIPETWNNIPLPVQIIN